MTRCARADVRLRHNSCSQHIPDQARARPHCAAKPQLATPAATMAAATPALAGTDTANKMSTSTLRERPVYWEGGVLHLVNQPALPEKFEIVTASTVEEIAAAIKAMTVRGAPAIGAAGAYGMFCGARESGAASSCVATCQCYEPRRALRLASYPQS